MPPLNQVPIVEIGLSEQDKLKIESGKSNSTEWDPNASTSSELSIDVFTKDDGSVESEDLTVATTTSSSSSSPAIDEGEDASNSSSDGWDPEDSDYSLNILLPSSSSSEVTSQDSLLGSDYSLDYKFAKDKQQPKEDTSDKAQSETAAAAIPSADNKRGVKFYSRVRVHRVETRKSLDEKLKETVWYTRDQFKDIRRECLYTLKRMIIEGENWQDDDMNGMSSRGLEYKVPEVYKARQHHKMEMRTVILEEQDFQIENELLDLEWMGKLSEDLSRSSVEAAIQMAMKDAVTARDYLQS